MRFFCVCTESKELELKYGHTLAKSTAKQYLITVGDVNKRNKISVQINGHDIPCIRDLGSRWG
jgi:hypothetical protein